MKKAQYVQITALVLIIIGSFSASKTLITNSRSNLALISGAGSGLINYWSLDEGSGSAAADGAGGASVTLFNTTWTGGSVGSGALSFSGSSGSYAQTQSSIAVPSGGFSFSFWMKSSASSPTGGIVSWNDQRFCRFGGVSANTVNCSVTGSSGGSAVSTSALNDGNWHHVVFTSTANSQQLYVDGVQQGNATQALGTSAGQISLGSFIYGSGASAVVIDDVRIYDHPLVQSDISALFALGGTSGGGGTPPTSTTYSLTVTKTGAGTGSVSGGSISCGGTCSQTNISSGTSINLAASASAGSTFTGWSGACSGTGSCNVTVTSNTTVTANFDLSSTPPPPSSGGLLFQWGFDEGSGTTVSDSSGNGLTGTLVNSPQWVTGVTGQGLKFNGVSTYVRGPANSAVVSGTTGNAVFSVSEWIKPDVFSASAINARNIITLGNTVDSGGWSVVYEPTHYDSAAGTTYDLTSGHIRFYYDDPVSSDLSLTDSTELAVNTWHHVVTVYDQPNRSAKIYIDGVLRASTSQLGSGIISPSNQTVSVGSLQSNLALATFNGVIDDIRIYSKSLTVSEIQSLYNTGISSLSGDNTPPTISIASPTSFATVANSITLTANASDGSGIAGVQFKVNGQNVGSEDTTSPYSFSWDSTTVANGTHYVSARARDTAGNQTASVQIAITVNNTSTLPPVASSCEVSSPRKCWYVDNALTTGLGNGSSWANAWRSIGAINWTSVQPGDVVYISGGATSKTYNERIVPTKSGTAGLPITIKTGQDAGHNGMVILDRNFGAYYGILIESLSYITVSGQVGSDPNPHMRITEALEHGVFVHGNCNNIRLSYLDITQNGNVYPSYGLTFQTAPHSQLGEIDHNWIHDNYSDELEIGVTGTPEQTLANSGSYNYFGSLKVHHNDIYNWHADAVKIFTAGTDFYNNSIHDRGIYRADHPDGIQAWPSYLRIYNNRFYNFSNSIYPVTDGPNSYIRYEPAQIPNVNVDGNPRHVYIYNNLFYEALPPTPGHLLRGIELSFWPQWWNTSTGGYATGPGTNIIPLIESVSNIYVVNNTFVNVPFVPILLSTSGHSGNYISNVVIENNVIKDSCSKSVCSGVLSLTKGTGTNVTYGGHGSGANVIVDYNSISGSTGYSTDIDFSGPGVTTIMTYSAFKSACPGCQAHDVGSPSANQLLDASYQTLVGSPLIDAGTSFASIFTTDIVGTTRPRGTAWDMGAYESSGGGGVTPTILGDFNGDGRVNSIDFSYMNSKWNTSDATADLNKDGRVNTLDFAIMSRNWTS